MRITEHFSKRYNDSYPKPIWENAIDLQYSIMERHLDNEEVKKCYDLMKANEEIYEGKRIIFFDRKELGLAWTSMVFQIGEEMIAEYKKQGFE